MKRKDFQLIGVNDDFLSLMDDSGETRDDLKCPEDTVGDEIKSAIDKEQEILVSGNGIDCTPQWEYYFSLQLFSQMRWRNNCI